MLPLQRSKWRPPDAAIIILAFAIANACQPARADSGQPAVDLELVLAVDVSGSMSATELMVQRQGYVAALRHPDVAEAIAMRGGAAIAYFEWAGPSDQKIVVPWTVVADVASAEKFAARLAEAPLHPGFTSPAWMTGTSISEALLFASGMFRYPGANHVIDISGNGPNNGGSPMAAVRDWVVAQGVTINGLPVVDRGGNFPVAVYYKDCVVGGQGAFALAIDRAEEFASTLRRKIVLEIAAVRPRFALVAYEQAPPRGTDCGVAEASD
jgi:hypothetical protein